MKKRIDVLVLLIAIVVTLTGCGKTTTETPAFILRNGIQFGDSVEVVKQKETTLEFESHKPATSEDEDETLVYKGTISGIEESTAEFVFSDGKLKSMLYTLGDSYLDADETDTSLHRIRHSIVSDQYEKVKNGLSEKYGAPLSEDCGFYGSELDGIITLELGNAMFGFGSSNDFLQYDEWFFQVGQDYVKIDQIYEVDITSWAGYYDHYVEYTLIPASELLEKTVDAVEEHNTVTNDL